MTETPNLEPGKTYIVTLKHTFALPFSHYEDEYGHKIACFETPGETRFGKQYRKVGVDAQNLHSIHEVDQ